MEADSNFMQNKPNYGGSGGDRTQATRKENIMNAINLREILETQKTFLERLYFVLVRTGYRRDRGDIAFVPINDTLEVQFKLNIADLIEESSIAVFNDLIERADLSIEEVLEAAFENTERMLQPRLEKMSDILPIPMDIDIPMYVLTNERKIFGAGAILYSGMKERLESVVGEDFIVIPSSVHETIIVPSFLTSTSITDIIKEVNRTTVSELEVLSDRPYKLVNDRELIDA